LFFLLEQENGPNGPKGMPYLKLSIFWGVVERLFQIIKLSNKASLLAHLAHFVNVGK